MTGPYEGTLVVFGTRHGKEQQAARPFAELLGARVVAPPGLDTDRFGTFSGEVPRTLAPLDAARAKAAFRTAPWISGGAHPTSMILTARGEGRQGRVRSTP